MSSLIELAERCEKATGPDRELDALIRLAVYAPASANIQQSPINGAWCIYDGLDRYERPKLWVGLGRDQAFTASLDAALTLVPEGWQVDQLGEWYDLPLRRSGPWMAILVRPNRPLNDGGSGGGGDPYVRCQHAPTPALALCAAALRARGKL